MTSSFDLVIFCSILFCSQDPKQEDAFAFSSHNRLKNLNQEDRKHLLHNLSIGKLSIKEFRVQTFHTYQKYEIFKSLISMLKNEGQLEVEGKNPPKLTDLFVS